MLTPPSDRRLPFWPLQLGGWLAFAVAMALSRVGTLPLGFMVVAKGVLAAGGLVVTLALRPVFRRLARRRGPPWWALGISLVLSYAAALAWTAAYNVFYAAFRTAYLGRPLYIDRLGLLFDGAVYNAFVIFAWSVLYLGLKSYEALQAERERSLRAEALAHEARLRALRYQLNPHFLFNTLNAISTLVVDGRGREASAMIARLSDFLRLTLASTDTADIPLAEEIRFARQYLEIEQVRFGDRLRVDVSVTDDVLDEPVPALILQPLVENAIKHAVSLREGGGHIGIDARRDGAALVVRVTDDGPGERVAPAPAAAGIGLANTRERLAQRYGKACRLELTALLAGGLEVRLHIPTVETTP